jgi:hypothetical protein
MPLINLFLILPRVWLSRCGVNLNVSTIMFKCVVEDTFLRCGADGQHL